MLKGILQGCLLILLTKKEMYGYKISQELEQYGFQGIPKGTIYPLLLNMEKKGLITGKMRPSSDGPKRKYYRISEKGLGEKKIFLSEWQSLANSVDQLIKKDK
ncbi:PadR family transcriptional regulator [Oenococcus oeni]|nr:PadR family transcriptional regulator [Oenococcus oeni]